MIFFHVFIFASTCYYGFSLPNIRSFDDEIAEADRLVKMYDVELGANSVGRLAEPIRDSQAATNIDAGLPATEGSDKLDDALSIETIVPKQPSANFLQQESVLPIVPSEPEASANFLQQETDVPIVPSEPEVSASEQLVASEPQSPIEGRRPLMLTALPRNDVPAMSMEVPATEPLVAVDPQEPTEGDAPAPMQSAIHHAIGRVSEISTNLAKDVSALSDELRIIDTGFLKRDDKPEQLNRIALLQSPSVEDDDEDEEVVTHKSKKKVSSAHDEEEEDNEEEEPKIHKRTSSSYNEASSSDEAVSPSSKKKKKTTIASAAKEVADSSNATKALLNLLSASSSTWIKNAALQIARDEALLDSLTEGIKKTVRARRYMPHGEGSGAEASLIKLGGNLAATSLVKDVRQKEAPLYFTTSSEVADCPHGTGQVLTESECHTAAVSLGRSRAFSGSWNDHVSGCMMGYNGLANIHWNEGGQKAGPHGFKVCKTTVGSESEADESPPPPGGKDKGDLDEPKEFEPRSMNVEDDEEEVDHMKRVEKKVEEALKNASMKEAKYGEPIEDEEEAPKEVVDVPESDTAEGKIMPVGKAVTEAPEASSADESVDDSKTLVKPSNSSKDPDDDGDSDDSKGNNNGNKNGNVPDNSKDSDDESDDKNGNSNKDGSSNKNSNKGKSDDDNDNDGKNKGKNDNSDDKAKSGNSTKSSEEDGDKKKKQGIPGYVVTFGGNLNTIASAIVWIVIILVFVCLCCSSFLGGWFAGNRRAGGLEAARLV